MKALVWEAPRVMNMRDQAAPDVKPDEVIIKVDYAGICGSELSGYLGHNALRVPPLVMGHEFAGEVTEIGAEAQSRYPLLKIGQRVTANPLVYCGTCVYCQSGLNQLCVQRKLIGAARPGAYARYVSVPARMVTTLPPGVTTRLGALTEPIACAVRIGELAGNVGGATCLIIGAGPIGLLSLQVLLLRGAKRVFIAERDPARLAMAGDLGGEVINAGSGDTITIVKDATEGIGAPVCIDAVGSAGTRQQCISSARSNGTVILSGLHEETSVMPAAEIIRREITVRGSFAYSPANFAEALHLLATGSIRLDPWIIESPLADGGQWFERLVDKPGAVAKVLLVP